MTIEDFIEQRIAEDEKAARAAGERAVEWKEMDAAVVGGPFTPAEPEYLIEESGTHTIVYPEGWPLKSEAEHIARHDPARVLRQCTALRKILHEHVPIKRIDYLNRPRVEIDVCECCSYLAPAATDAEDDCVSWPCDQIKAIAAIWSDRPDYRPEWGSVNA